MFNFSGIYSFISVSGCVGIGPSELFCPGTYDTVKIALFKGTFVYPVFIIHSNFSTDRGPVIWENGYFNSLHVQYQ